MIKYSVLTLALQLKKLPCSGYVNKFFAVRALFLLSALLLTSLSANAQLDINIGGGTVRGIPTAIVPFKVADGSVMQTNVAQVIAADLAASGKFEPLATQNFMSFPSRDEDVRFKDWRFIDAEALVIGEVWTLGDDLYELQFRIYDVAREQAIGGLQRISNLRAQDLRSAAHVISDNVYTSFTGRPGAFNSRIAYIKRSTVDQSRQRYRLMVADWDGYGAQEVYASWKPLLSPAWSTDSKKLAFVAFADSGAVVKVIDLAAGKSETIASFKGVNSAPAWSPDGAKLAYSSSRNGSPDVFVYDVYTKQHQRITTHYGIDTEPSWSPDGRQLLFTSSRTGKPQVYSYEFGSNSSTRVTFEGKENANGSFDYSGQQIVLVNDGGRIAVLEPKNSKMTLLSNAKFDESPSFSPNGDMVLYASEYQYTPALVVASSDGRIQTKLEFVSGDVREPAWSSLKR